MKNSIRKALVILFLLLFVCGLYAQKDSSKVYDFEQGSEVGISYGYGNLMAGRYTPNDLWYNVVNTVSGGSLSFSDYLKDENIRRGSTYVTGIIHLTYTYRLKRWFEISGKFVYSGIYTNYYDSVLDDSSLYRHGIHTMSAVVTARLVWLNRRYVRLYSSIGVGLSTIVETGDDRKAYTQFAADFAYFGIKAGGKIYGFAELSAGVSGYITAGIGFNLSKWRN